MHYSFGASTFSTFLLIKNGDLFSNVSLVEVEMINSGSFRLEVLNRSGIVISSSSRSNTNGGWSTFDFSSGMNPPVINGMSPYQLRFVNESAGERRIKLGNVHY